MKYSGGLVKKEREQIFKLFTQNTRLKFNEIEKAIKIRSNMVSYHLEQMQKEGLLEKKGDYYYLTKESEKYLPIIPQVTGESMSPVPVVLVALMNKNKILLIKRNNRPYKGYWCMIGGKMLLEESFAQASKRLVKEKSNLDAEYVSINNVLHEQVEGDDMVKHSFILFFTKMKTEETRFRRTEYGDLQWFDLNELDKLKIVPSDLWLIKNKLDSTIDVKEAYMKEKEGQLNSFEMK
ncbi:NUDIX domain-containing protein [Candidatus Woesearchaeota archaeon]|nr:NUDIX domain-containing protein [Candidatus Woesearchaeota archaeon]MBW3018367.1 NUDIX domain-containing protein [Candidatus Woesearchaeota archaeon]